MINPARFLKSGFTFFFLFFFMHISAQQSVENLDLHKKVQQQTGVIFEDLVEVRRDLHRFPEVSGEEKNTSAKVADYLTSLGLEVRRNIGGNGVIGILKGDKPGRRVAWRADMDAMPSREPDVVDFASEIEGVRHICGHDVHTSIGLGIANNLSELKEELQGTVYFIFQPSEEDYKGAKAMMDDGLFDVIDPQEIYGLHISPWPVGTLVAKPGSVYAHTNTLTISWKKSNSPEDLIEYTKELVSGFQNVPADSKFWDLRNLEDPEAGLESPKTVFTNFLTVRENFSLKETDSLLILSTMVNTSDKQQMDALPGNIRQRIAESPNAALLEKVEYSYEKVSVMNDEKLTAESLDAISAIYGKEAVIPVYGVVPGGRGDDFAYFQQKVPGVYYFLGGANFETGLIPMPHAADFAVDEESIRFGVNFFTSVLLERLNAGE